MIRLSNLKHSEHMDKIEFDVTRNGTTHHVEVSATTYGATMTNIDDFAEGWSDEDYYALDNFVSATTDFVRIYDYDTE